MYLQEVQKAYVSLTVIDEAFSSFNLSGSLFNQVKLLAREIEKKDKDITSARVILFATKAHLSVVQEDLENFPVENIYLSQKLNKLSITGLATVYESL